MDSDEGPDHGRLSDEIDSPGGVRLTETQLLQAEAEVDISERVLRYILMPSFSDLSEYVSGGRLELVFVKDKHVKYIKSTLGSFDSDHLYLDASRPWVLYWALNSLTLMNEEIDSDLARRTAEALELCRDPLTGAYCGGMGQIPHLGATYAAICTLSIIGEPYISSLIDRQGILEWMLRLKQQDGSFAVHDGGEIDLRGVYCAVAVADMLSLNLDVSGEIGNFIASCQTHEGGLAGIPGAEAHGGYSYCGLAALVMLRQEHKIDVDTMAGFPEGGFRGRTNKLVDGCYSFWQGGVVLLLTMIFDNKRIHMCNDFFNRRALQVFLLSCCQKEDGGFTDKPNGHPDLYHTCYCISGYSLSTSAYSRCKITNIIEATNLCDTTKPSTDSIPPADLGAAHPYYNIRMDFVKRIKYLYTKKDGS